METFTRDGMTFDVTDAGPRDGEVVVLLHGFPQDRTAWDDVTPRLNEAGYRTLALDQRGYSPRATPPGRTSYTLAELGKDTLALIDAAGATKAHVVGHDWGGALAWYLASRYPERVASLTVLSTPHPAAMAWAFTHSDQWKKSWYMVMFQLPGAHKVVHKKLPRIYRGMGLSPQKSDQYVARFPRAEMLIGPLGWYRSMPASSAMLKSVRSSRSARSAPSTTKAPRRITVPTTYIWGSRDAALGRAAAEKTAEYVASDYRFVELDENHWLPEMKTDEVVAGILERSGSVAR